MTSCIRYGFICLIVVVLCSCGKEDTLYLPGAVTKAPLQQTHRLLLVDKNIRNALLYVNSVNNRLPGGQLLVRVNFQNQRDDAVWADVMIEFQDADGIAIDQTAWIPTRFPAKLVTPVQGTSITPHATKHVVLLKNLRGEDGRGIGPADIMEIQ